MFKIEILMQQPGLVGCWVGEEQVALEWGKVGSLSGVVRGNGISKTICGHALRSDCG